MKFDVFCEIQRPYPWGDRDEASLFQEMIEQAQAADRAGFEVWWQVEHHGSPEFSYSAAPELLLTAIALSTERLRVGHAGVLAPFRINHPLRVAERGATLDILSKGRFELGLARSGGKEWQTFGVDPETARDQVREAMQMIPRMWTQKEFSWSSKHIEIPEREVTPKPITKPHPRLWQTCGSPESFYMAGELGVGALGTTLLSPVPFLGQMLQQYRKGLANSPAPVGQVVNDQAGVFTFVHVAPTREEAIASGAAWSALWYVNAAPIIFKVPRSVWYDTIKAGLHPNSAQGTAAISTDATSLEIEPDDPDVLVLLKLMAKGEKVSFRDAHEVLEKLDCVIIGDPDHCIEKVEGYRGIGADRLMCLMQFGTIPHADVVRSIGMWGADVAPAFQREPKAGRRASA